MTVQTSDQRVATRIIGRRKLLALGAAGVVTAALSACGGNAAATATGASNTVAAAGSTVQTAATQVMGSAPAAGSTAQAVGGTVQAAVSQAPGGVAGIAGTVQAAATANPGIVASVQAAGTQVAGSAPAVASSAQVAGGTAAAAGASAATAAVGSAASATGGDVASRNNKYQGKPPAMTIDKSKKYTATIVTNKGTMKAELYADTAPISVNNFVFLANEHFYDGVIFHRIVKGFVIQGGDPTGMGTGGPGYKFMDEPTSFTRNYEKGTLAMANSGANTNGSQFFICLDNLTAGNKLPKMYNIFGKVTDGLNVVDAIAATPTMKGATGENSTPTERVFMQTVTVSSQ